MPPLPNPRHEAFAQALFIGLGGETRQERSQQHAYLTAYPNSSTAAAKTSASRLLTRANHIFERVRELQAEQAARTQRKIDVSRERIARNLDLASTIAQEERNAANIVSAETAIAKIFGHEPGAEHNATSFQSARTMRDIATRLLQCVGFREPTDVAIEAAMAANADFVERIEEIRAQHDPEYEED